MNNIIGTNTVNKYIQIEKSQYILYSKSIANHTHTCFTYFAGKKSYIAI